MRGRDSIRWWTKTKAKLKVRVNGKDRMAKQGMW